MSFRMQERVAWADIAKVLGIYAIFLGHLDLQPGVIQYLFSFHVPLFFFVSGFLFDPGRYPSFKPFFIKRLRSLLVPYFAYAFSLYAFWLIVLRSLSVQGAALKVHPLQPLLPILYGGGLHYGESVPVNAPLWFLTCLFLIEILFWLANRVTKGNRGALFSILILFGMMSWVESSTVSVRLPWNVDKALNGIVFYGAAYACKGWINAYAGYSNRSMAKILLLFLFCILNLLFCFLNQTVNYNFNIYHNLFYYYLAAFSGALFYIGLSSYIPPHPALCYLGRNTLVLLGMGSVLFAFAVKALFYVFTGKFPGIEILSIGQGVLVAALQILSVVPFIHLINHRFPFVLGRKPAGRMGPPIYDPVLAKS